MASTDVVVPFPVALNLEGRRCIVIGDDAEADQKEILLRESGALVERVRSIEIDQSRLRDVFFVISTPQDARFSARLRALADRHRFLLCCIDQPAYGFVSMAAIAKSGPVRIAISTAGVAPRVGKLIKNALQKALDGTFARFVSCQATLKRRNRRRFSQSSSMRREAMIAAARGFGLELGLHYPQWFEDAERARLPRIVD